MTRLTFLGSGTSQGVPIIGCHCPVCSSSDPRDKRFRASVLVEYEGLNILVDAGPDFRSQMLRSGVCHLDAILLTHNHKDHTGGLDDLRSLNYTDKRAAEIYCERRVYEDLRREYPYAFTEPRYPGAPEWHIHLIDERPFLLPFDAQEKELVWVHDVGYRYRLPDGSLQPSGNQIDQAQLFEGALVEGGLPEGGLTGGGLTGGGLTEGGLSEGGLAAGALAGGSLSEGSLSAGALIVPIRGYHHDLPVLGYRFADIAYITDMSRLPDSELPKLQGLKHITLNTVSYKSHHSHFSLDEALQLADKIGAENTWLTHLSHTFPVYQYFAAELEALCRQNHIRSTVRPAYDGLVVG